MVDWESIREECRHSGEMIKIPKSKTISLPPDFHESNLGLSKGAIRQYRDRRSTHSLHVHEFPDYFLAHVDTFNPEYHPVAHGMVDTPGMTMGIILGTVTLYFLLKTAQSLHFVPEEELEDW